MGNLAGGSYVLLPSVRVSRDCGSVAGMRAVEDVARQQSVVRGHSQGRDLGRMFVGIGCEGYPGGEGSGGAWKVGVSRGSNGYL
ncbi:hypothetical protein KI387_019026, partial [Taxus chinensis]